MQHTYITDLAHAARAVDWFLNRPSHEVIGIDLETAKHPEYTAHPQAGLNPDLSRIRLVQLAAGERIAIVDAFRVPVQVIEPLMKRGLVAHNSVFELKHLLTAGLNPMHLHCTLLADRVVSGARRTLAELSLAYLGESLSKDLQLSEWGARELSTEQLSYAAKDAELCHRLYPILQEKLVAFPNGWEAYKVLLKAVRPVARLELTGVPIDLEQCHALYEREGRKRDALLREWQADNPNVNPNSTKQLNTLLRKALPPHLLAGWKRTPSGILSTGKDDLDNAADVPALQALVAYKQSKRRIDFVEGLIEYASPVTGRIHTDLLIATARTFRFSCTNPPMQQAPRAKEVRALFRAADGRVLVAADYSQMELRVMAWLSRDPTMLTAYQQGLDLHRLTAARIAGVPEDHVTKEQRQAAKAVNFGLIFGMQPPTLIDHAWKNYRVRMTLSEGERAYAAFFACYPRVRIWQAKEAAKARYSLLSAIPGGFYRRYDRKDPVSLPKAANTPDQGGCGVVMLHVLPLVDRVLEGMDARVVLTVHDEILVETTPDHVPRVQQALEAAMTAGFETVFPEARALGLCNGLVEAHAGRDWVEAKP